MTSLHYVIFLKRGSQAFVFTYLSVSLFSPCPGAFPWIDVLSHWNEPLQMSACSARAEKTIQERRYKGDF